MAAIVAIISVFIISHFVLVFRPDCIFATGSLQPQVIGPGWLAVVAESGLPYTHLGAALPAPVKSKYQWI